jgi:SAM-dependent methyltransferase
MWSYAWLLVLAFALMIWVTWTHSRGAPWSPTPMSEVHKMLEMAGVGPDDLVYDLGCGDGRLIVTAARRYGARAVGIEVDPLRTLWCRVLITVLGLRDRVRVVRGDFFAEDLRDADVVTCYLLQSTNETLEEKLQRELGSSTRVVSYEFTFPGLHLMGQDDEAEVYLYNVGP